MTAHPSPQDVAALGARGRLVPSDGPLGDADLDRALAHLRASVDHLIGVARSDQTDGAEPAPDMAGAVSPRDGRDDAGEVVTRAHEAQEALQARLKEAQA